MEKLEYQLHSPAEIASQLAAKVRQLRLDKNWKQATLAERSGVNLSSLRRFEHTNRISLKNLLRLVTALGRLNDFDEVLKPPKAHSIKDLDRQVSLPARKRGSR
jgi:HTH-type transcriptional regulator / antitoxin HipB